MKQCKRDLLLDEAGLWDFVAWTFDEAYVADWVDWKGNEYTDEYANVYGNSGLCGALIFINSAFHSDVVQRAELRMEEARPLESCSPYWWPITKEGARKRATFARKMARAARKEARSYD